MTYIYTSYKSKGRFEETENVAGNSVANCFRALC